MLMGLPEDIVLDEEGISRGFEDKVLHKRLRRVVISLGRDTISLPDEKGNSRLCTRVNKRNTKINGCQTRTLQCLFFSYISRVTRVLHWSGGHVVQRQSEHIVRDEPGLTQRLEHETLREPVRWVLVSLEHQHLSEINDYYMDIP